MPTRISVALADRWSMFPPLTLSFGQPAFSRIEKTWSTRSFGVFGAISRYTEVISDGLLSL